MQFRIAAGCCLPPPVCSIFPKRVYYHPPFLFLSPRSSYRIKSRARLFYIQAFFRSVCTSTRSDSKKVFSCPAFFPRNIPRCCSSYPITFLRCIRAQALFDSFFHFHSFVYRTPLIVQFGIVLPQDSGQFLSPPDTPYLRKESTKVCDFAARRPPLMFSVKTELLPGKSPA